MTIIRTDIQSDAHWHALRRAVVGASEAPALCGVHEYLTYYQLWGRKTGRLPVIDDNAAMQRGRMLEPIAVALIREEYPEWNATPPRAHYADQDTGLGCTPDLLATDPERGPGSIQIKSVAPRIFRHSWHGDSDAVDPPIWIVMQAITEAYLTGSAWAAVAALVIDHDIQLHMVDVPMHAGIITKVQAEAIAFWRMVTEGREPDPDYRRDGEVLRTLLQQDDGTEIDLSAHNELPELIAMREDELAQAKLHKENADALNTQLLHMLGAASLGRFNGGFIAAKTVHRKGYEVKPSTYRQLRVVMKETAA
jgi:hypothetical protein